MEHRAKIRAEAQEKGIWPRSGGGDSIVTQNNMICMLSPFSPVQ